MQTVTPSSCSSMAPPGEPSVMASTTTAAEADDEASSSLMLGGEDGGVERIAKSVDTAADLSEAELEVNEGRPPVNILNASKKGLMNEGELSALILRLKLLADSDNT